MVVFPAVCVKYNPVLFIYKFLYLFVWITSHNLYSIIFVHLLTDIGVILHHPINFADSVLLLILYFIMMLMYSGLNLHVEGFCTPKM